jgi:hypothetical protein
VGTEFEIQVSQHLLLTSQAVAERKKWLFLRRLGSLTKGLIEASGLTIAALSCRAYPTQAVVRAASSFRIWASVVSCSRGEPAWQRNERQILHLVCKIPKFCAIEISFRVCLDKSCKNVPTWQNSFCVFILCSDYISMKRKFSLLLNWRTAKYDASSTESCQNPTISATTQH